MLTFALLIVYILEDFLSLQFFITKVNCRKGLPQLTTPKSETSSTNLTNRVNGVFDVANLVLRLLPSQDGVVLRRLLMTAVSAIYLDSFPLYTSHHYHFPLWDAPLILFQVMSFAHPRSL